jgi:hypothetical protein
VVAGALPVASYLIYLYHVHDLIKKWAKTHDKVRHTGAVYAYLPIQLGGLGVESMNSLGGSISHTQFADCIGRLKLIGIRFPALRDTITKLIKVRVRGRKGIAELTNPGGIVAIGPHLRNDRLQIAIEKNLISKVSAPVIQVLVPVLEANVSGYLHSVLESGNSIPVPLREALYNMTPHALVRRISAKFLRARSAKTLVNMNRFRGINYANIRDAEDVLRPFVV